MLFFETRRLISPMKVSKPTQPNSNQLNVILCQKMMKQKDSSLSLIITEDLFTTLQVLQVLSKKNTTLVWTETCQKAFETLRDKLISTEILRYPDFTKPFIQTTDASNIALGVILSQGEIGKDRPISYASKSLNKHERNKRVIILN